MSDVHSDLDVDHVTPNQSVPPNGDSPAETKPKARQAATSRRKAQSASTKPRARRKPATSRAKQTKTSSSSQAKFPRHPVDRALRIPKALYEQNGGKPATPKEAAVFTGGTSVTGAFNVEMSFAKKYGFLVSEGGKLALTDRARSAIAPQSVNDRLNALREAILAAPDISTVYNYYRGENLPDDQFLMNALTDRFHIPNDKVNEFLPIFLESVRSAELIDESGQRKRLIDVGRDESHRPVSGKPAKAQVSVGTTCFVVQPFVAPFGSYFESIFKPAIEQAGLTPVRADAEIFGTGKVIDQIWRGINAAKVLVAELTTKNPNVFYELGLAHALRKPVILISSNRDDVPFNL